MGYGSTFNNDFNGTDSSTHVTSFDADFTYPIILNENNALITGASFNLNNLQLFPDANFTDLYSTSLHIGLASTYNERWSSTVVLLPKIASDYNHITSSDFYFGGFAVLKYQKKSNLKYRFGVYASSEAFGLFITPIVGWYYLSDNNRFEMDMSLPISADANYKLGKATVGIDYFGIGRSYRLYGTSDVSYFYAENKTLEFATYLQYKVLKGSVLLRAKFGYSTNSYEVYADGDKIDLGFSAFSIGDDRVQLNPEISGGAFLKFEALYRFQITSKEPDKR